MRVRLRALVDAFTYHQARFDSMPDTPGMGYFMEAWGLHSPGWDHAVSLERTRGKIAKSSSPVMRGVHANNRIKVTSYPLGISWEFNLHPRHIEVEFGYAWLEPYGDEGKRRHVSAGPPYIPEPGSVWSDVRRHREREHLATREHERIDPPEVITGDADGYMPYGDPEGITAHAPGIVFKAWQPANSSTHCLVLDVCAAGDDTVLRQYIVRLMYEPRFGIDEGDAYAFDILTRDVEMEMLQASWMHDRPPCPVCHEPLWTVHDHDNLIVSPGDARTDPEPELAMP